MFTGLIEALGSIASIERTASDARLEVSAVWPGPTATPSAAGGAVGLGDSVAVNGCCLTVVRFEADGEALRMWFDASHETLARTSLGQLQRGDQVNLERALRVGDRLGGHWVTGHVDAVGQRVAVRRNGEAWDLDYALPAALEPEVVEKGSVAIDGVSLTVNRVWPGHLGVTIIPHTAAHTQLLAGADRGAVHDTTARAVNLETDLLAKHVRRLAGFGGAASN